ncbi:MAG TPA: DinB family protein [Terriglobales bacterium]|nr:DinB family protein [Terriglobales bacterium]
MATAQPGLTPDFAIGYREVLLQGFDNEVNTTKKVLAAIPEGKRDYRPDSNARTAWELACHIASTDVWFLDGIADGKFNMEESDDPVKNKTVAELVQWYDENYKRASARVRAMTPEQLLTPISFFGTFNFPAVFYLGFLNNHCIHHRGALATYLRPMGAKVPSIYGGSYDEPFEMAAA